MTSILLTKQNLTAFTSLNLNHRLTLRVSYFIALLIPTIPVDGMEEFHHNIFTNYVGPSFMITDVRMLEHSFKKLFIF